jgi:hypothetical protein
MHPQGVEAFRPVTSQTITVGAVASQHGDFGQATLLRLWGTQRFRVEVGSNPTATADSMPVTAAVVQFIHIKPGEKISLIRLGTIDSSVTITTFDEN